MQEAIERTYLAGQREWPSLAHPTLEVFTSHVERLATSEPDLERHGTDVFLALCCGSNDDGAIRALERVYRAQLDEHLMRSGFDVSTRQDVLQQLMLHLCTGSQPRILTYAGKASLATWLKVATLRFAINMKPRAPIATSEVVELAISNLVDDRLSPELKLAIEGARPQFQAALARAMSSLSDRDTTILRLFFVDGISNDGIAKHYGVHRATSARWIADIRRRLFADVQRAVTNDLGLRPSEFESLAVLVRSELHLSFRRLFGVA